MTAALGLGLMWDLFRNGDGSRTVQLRPEVRTRYDMKTGDELHDIVAQLGISFGSGAPRPAPAVEEPPAPPPPPPPAPEKCADGDTDGLCDADDKCPGTPACMKMDKVGCPLEQMLRLLFDFDSAELLPESITELERPVQFMGDVPFATALVEGHTDSVGNDAYNLKLSDRRPRAVFDYLTSRGVDPARLGSIGKGESAPVADNATDAGRQENRRVMLIRMDRGGGATRRGGPARRPGGASPGAPFFCPATTRRVPAVQKQHVSDGTIIRHRQVPRMTPPARRRN